MLAGRFLMIVPALGDRRLDWSTRRSCRHGRDVPDQRRAVRRLLVGVILIVGALTFFPALSLGPIVEHFLAQHGKLF